MHIKKRTTDKIGDLIYIITIIRNKSNTMSMILIVFVYLPFDLRIIRTTWTKDRDTKPYCQIVCMFWFIADTKDCMDVVRMNVLQICHNMNILMLISKQLKTEYSNLLYLDYN